MNTFFEPWIGSGYSQKNYKILVIGDSHYCGGHERCGVKGNCSFEEMKDCNDFTQVTVKSYIDFRKNIGEKHGWMTKTFYPFDKIFYGKENVTMEESLELWNSISFYNFLQTAYIEEATNVFYSNTDYILSSPLCYNVIKELRPNLIIVWGNRAYNHLPNTNWEDGTNYYNGKYLIDNEIKCIRIYHPSRANVSYWHSVLTDFIGMEPNKLL
jgi:hypothetical protein